MTYAPQRSKRFSVAQATSRHAPLVALCVSIAVAVALGLSLVAPREHAVTAQVLVQPPIETEGLAGLLPATTRDAIAGRGTQIDILQSEAVRSATRERLTGTPGAAAVLDVEVDGTARSDLVDVIATARSPELARRVALTYVEAYTAVRERVVRRWLRDARAALGRQVERSAQARVDALLAAGDPELDAAQHDAAERQAAAFGRRAGALEQQIAELRIAATGQPAASLPLARPGAAIELAAPIVRNGLLGALAGLLLGIAAALWLLRRSRPLTHSDELAEAFGVPLLAAIPESRGLAGWRISRQLPPAVVESFRLLRAGILASSRGRPLGTVLVTSPSVGDGKSTVAFHLASTLAASGRRVLMLEGDVRRPVVEQRLGLPPAEGLAEILMAGRTIDEVLREVPSPSGPDAETLDIVSAGIARTHAGELLASKRMLRLLSEAEEHYDVVILDSPPAAIVADAMSLIERVSGVIVVGRLGELTHQQAQRLRDGLEAASAPVIGVVANGAGRDEFPFPAYDYGVGGATQNGRSLEAMTT